MGGGAAPAIPPPRTPLQVPHWIGNGAAGRRAGLLLLCQPLLPPHCPTAGSFFTPDNWLYQTNFANCVRSRVGAELDYIGIWNERCG